MKEQAELPGPGNYSERNMFSEGKGFKFGGK